MTNETLEFLEFLPKERVRALYAWTNGQRDMFYDNIDEFYKARIEIAGKRATVAKSRTSSGDAVNGSRASSDPLTISIISSELIHQNTQARVLVD